LILVTYVAFLTPGKLRRLTVKTEQKSINKHVPFMFSNKYKHKEF